MEFDIDSNINEDQLLNEFNSLKLYDPKVDTLFKLIFKQDKNVDVAVSLIKALLPEEEKIENLEFKDCEIYSSLYDEKTRYLRVDVYAINKDNNDKYIIEMQINEIPDGRSVLSASRLFDSLYTKNEDIVLKSKIYLINLLYYDLYPNDSKYYHYLFTHEPGNESTKFPFTHYIIIELKKFKEIFQKHFDSLEISSIQNINLIESGITTMMERELWCAYLSLVNYTLRKPQKGRYIELEKVRINDKKEEILKKYYVKNEISFEVFKMFIKYYPIRKALLLSNKINFENENLFLDKIENDEILKSKDKRIKEQDDQIIEQKKQIKEKDDQIKEKDDQIKEKDDQIKKQDGQINKQKNVIIEQESVITELKKRLFIYEQSEQNKKNRIDI